MSKISRAGVFALILMICLAIPKTTIGQMYEVTRLDPPSANFGNYSGAVAINDLGYVLGWGSAMYSTQITCLWQPGVPVPYQHYFSGYNNTFPGDLNFYGQIVGWGLTTDGSHGFLNSLDLGTGRATDINDEGQVVGWNYDSSYIYKDGVFNYFPLNSIPVAINDSGIAAGTVDIDCNPDCTGELRVGIFRNDSVILLGSPGGYRAEVTDINNRGQIVGRYCIGDNCPEQRGFIWDNGSWTIIPTLGGSSSEASAINEQGVVVGESRYTSGPSSLPTAIIYDTVNGLRDLNTLIPTGTGWDLWSAADINEHGEIVGVGKINGLTRAFLLTPAVNRFLEVQDVNGAPIPYTPVRISKVADDPPVYTETFLLVDTTDDQGQIKVNRSLRLPGQKMRIEIVAHEQPAVKGAAWFKNLYSVRLDNISFDSVGLPSFDTTTIDSVQNIKLDHTCIAINLVVSVQWNAQLDYLSSLESGLRLASNYLYDVTNGQAYLDTIRIYDNAENWNSADIQIFSSSDQWPEAFFGDRINGYGAYSADGTKTLRMPRLFYFNSKRANREMDWAIYPYSWTVALTTFDFDGDGPRASESKSFCPSRTIMHELGHYLFGFRDEYEDLAGNSIWPDFNYGMMDDQLIPGDIQSSEMSSVGQYLSADKQVTEHWVYRLGWSCWDWFEVDMGEMHNGIRCPIVRPDEIGPANHVVTGPNDVVLAPDYDIGSRLVFPVAHIAPLYTDKVARVQTFFGFPVEGAEVQIERGTGSGQIIIKQGKTNADGRIRIVGFQGSDEISADNGYVTSPAAATSAGFTARPAELSDLQWYFVEADRPGTSDNFILESRLVDGYFPAVFQLEHSDSLSTGLRVDVLNPFNGPGFGFNNAAGVFSDIPLLFDSVKYTAVAGGLGSSGTFSLNVGDNSSYIFRIQGVFKREKVSGGAPAQILSATGEVELILDSATTSSGLEYISMLATPYPVVRTGLNDDALRVSETHSIATSPDGPLAGAASLTIRYTSDGLTESEEQSISVFKWDEQLRTWNLHGGTADIDEDEVNASMSQGGTYAAFTTASPSGVHDDDPENLPYNFSVSQNYPNPFNPVTTIAYSVPSRTEVTVEIFNVLGQGVRTLVHETKSAGTYHAEWNGLDDAGLPVSTGVYLYRFTAGDTVQTKKMLLLK